MQEWYNSNERVMPMTIKELRKEKSLTQAQASKITGVPLRTFKMYENDPRRIGTIKYKYILQELDKYGLIDETHGVLSLEKIKGKCSEVFCEYPVEYCILFGSYAKGRASEISDVDLLVSTELTGIEFFGLVEALRQALNKRVDVINAIQLDDNEDLLRDVLKDGVRIYVQEDTAI